MRTGRACSENSLLVYAFLRRLGPSSSPRCSSSPSACGLCAPCVRWGSGTRSAQGPGRSRSSPRRVSSHRILCNQFKIYGCRLTFLCKRDVKLSRRDPPRRRQRPSPGISQAAAATLLPGSRRPQHQPGSAASPPAPGQRRRPSPLHQATAALFSPSRCSLSGSTPNAACGPLHPRIGSRRCPSSRLQHGAGGCCPPADTARWSTTRIAVYSGSCAVDLERADHADPFVQPQCLKLPSMAQQWVRIDSGRRFLLVVII